MTPGTARRALAAAITTVLAATALAVAPAATAVPRPGTAPAASATTATATASASASATEDPALSLVGTSLGPVVRLTAPREDTFLSWTLSRSAADWTVELTHRQTGLKQSWRARQPGSIVQFGWSGDLTSWQYGPGVRAPGGDYSWRLTAKPQDGVGPDLDTSGTFRLTRDTHPRDFSDNGSPDLLFRDFQGGLTAKDTFYDGRVSEVAPAGSSPLGSGWEYYPQLEAVGDVAGTDAGDLIGIDRVGYLWLFQGTGRPGVSPRVKVGRGWEVYDRLAGGSDLTGDGRADLVAVDKTGDLWLYKSTGNPDAPFAPRRKTGFGWNIYDKLIATGNIGGAPAGDLLARDRNGVLWLYLGKGDGTFAPRARVGAGWNQYTHIVGIGDATLDGTPDLYAIGPYNTVYTYSGTGDWHTPFRTRKTTKVLADLPLQHVEKIF
ncbi:FG-GAP repeat domain-containing protein [Streptomyces sp. NPDC059247]|uniref:FG-GAP repeat domain-containing protein n=1 Tax=Streptomyces sp. NPDC059247 TaxID=3346790 RepID=UPI0036839519